MPPRCTAGLRAYATAIAAVYLAPVALPAVSGLLHEGFHVLGEPVLVHGGESHSHGHPDGGTAHSHTALVDTLLTADVLTEAVLEDAHAPAPESLGPGLHLPQTTDQLSLLPEGYAAPPAGETRDAAGAAHRPPTPPPRA